MLQPCQDWKIQNRRNLGKMLLAFFLLVNNALSLRNNGEKDCFIEAMKVKLQILAIVLCKWP